jgi:hypothetical protein
LQTDRLAERGGDMVDERDPREHDAGLTTVSGWAVLVERITLTPTVERDLQKCLSVTAAVALN